MTRLSTKILFSTKTFLTAAALAALTTSAFAQAPTPWELKSDMMFGGPTDEATSSRIVAKAREAGINFIDTADAYNGGNSEAVVGRAISNNRHNWILATKLANQIGDDPNRGGLSRRWVLQAADESLKRLGTDFIDIYYLHKEDHKTPLEETVRAIGDLMRQGKIRYFGVSNYRAWRVAEICNICDNNGIDRPIVSQPYYNAMDCRSCPMMRSGRSAVCSSSRAATSHDHAHHHPVGEQARPSQQRVS